MPSPHSVTVTIPGTSANLGPGFDSFGIAFTLANQITLQKEVSSPALPWIAQEAAALFFTSCNLTPFPFSMTITGDVPRSRGLGSSVTVRLGILMGLNELLEKPLSSLEMYTLCSTLEGHPDNTAPALLGGFTIARASHKPVRYEVSSDLSFILLIPPFEVATTQARRLLPSMITTSDAAANAADAAVIATAFATQNYELLRGSFLDRLHQPFRTPLVPFLPHVLSAAEEAGALGGWLSGSGSTIAAFSNSKKDSLLIAAAMKQSAPEGCTLLITQANNQGVTIV